MFEIETHFPLRWPSGRPKTQNRVEGRFSCAFEDAWDGLIRSLRLFGAEDVIISSNIPLRKTDGLPDTAKVKIRVSDPGVSVFFKRNGKDYVMAADYYQNVRDNLRAIGITVEAYRTISRHGADEMLEQAITGFLALPAPKSTKKEWHEVLGVRPDAKMIEVAAAHKKLLSLHPDRGGSDERMAEVNAARDEARRVLCGGA